LSQPLVSIVIPCFNAEPFIGEAIESALGQTYPHKEVIVIDDGSTDQSLEVIRSFGDRLRWETGPNRMACAARNRGLELANGEFVQFLDADDLLHVDKLEKQVPQALANRPQIVYCQWTSELIEEGAGNLQSSSLTYPDPVVQALRKIIQTSASLYPVSMLSEVQGWREDLTCAQDFDLNLRLACAGASFYQMNDSLLTLRRRAGSVSSNMVQVLDQSEGIYWRAFGELRDRDELTDDRAAAFAAGFASHGRVYLQYGCVEQAKARFRDAFQMHPSGGLNGAYQPWTRTLRRFLGPVATEKLVHMKRRLRGQTFRSL